MEWSREENFTGALTPPFISTKHSRPVRQLGIPDTHITSVTGIDEGQCNASPKVISHYSRLVSFDVRWKTSVEELEECLF